MLASQQSETNEHGLVQDEYEHRGHDIVDVSHGGVEDRAHVHPQGCVLFQGQGHGLTGGQDPSHLDFRAQGAGRRGQAFDHHPVDQEKRCISRVDQDR